MHTAFTDSNHCFLEQESQPIKLDCCSMASCATLESANEGNAYHLTINDLILYITIQH